MIMSGLAAVTVSGTTPIPTIWLVILGAFAVGVFAWRAGAKLVGFIGLAVGVIFFLQTAVGVHFEAAFHALVG